MHMHTYLNIKIWILGEGNHLEIQSKVKGTQERCSEGRCIVFRAFSEIKVMAEQKPKGEEQVVWVSGKKKEQVQKP